MLNIYDFFNSPDVAEHCQSIGHTFNALESAVIVRQSNSRTIAEKHAAYRTIIAEYPDMEVPAEDPDSEYSDWGYLKSFRKALGEILFYEEQILKNFLTPEPYAVYQASFEYKNSRESYTGNIFTSYEKALADMLDYTKDKEYDNPSYFYIYKKFLDSEKYIGVLVSRSGAIIWVDESDILQIPETLQNALDCLRSYYISISVPFKRGDIVECCHRGFQDGHVYVLVDNPECDTRSLVKDYVYVALYCEYNGIIKNDHIHGYSHLQYCRRKLEGTTRILKYVSLYVLDKITLGSLLEVQEFLLAEKKMNAILNSSDLQCQLKKIGDELSEPAEHAT